MVEAVAEAAYQNAERFAVAAVEETGMGVAEHKRRKNEACSRGILERYAVDDYVDVQIDADAKIVAVPKPAGVVLALTPSTNPIATVYFNVAPRADDAQRGRRLAAPARAQGLRRGRRTCSRRRRSPPARPTAACRWWRSRRSR